MLSYIYIYRERERERGREREGEIRQCPFNYSSNTYNI